MGSIRQHPKGVGYEARYRDPGGRSRSKTFRTKAEARTFLASTETDKHRGNWIDPMKGRVHFDKWAEEVMAGKVSQRSSGKDRDLSHLRNHVLPVFESAPLSAITRKHVRDWVKWLSDDKGLAPRTVRDCYAVLAFIMRQAVEERLIAESPCRKVELPGIPSSNKRFLTHDQVADLAGSMVERYSPLVFTVAYMGLRWEEVAALRRTRVDLLRRQMMVFATIERYGTSYRFVDDMKTRESRRTLDIPKPLAEMLGAYLGQHDDDFVFPSPKGGFLHYNNFRSRYWLPAVKRASLEPLGLHELRHTCVALQIEQGADLLAVSRFLGHKDITTTANTYGHLFPQRGQDVAAAMGEAMVKARTEAARGKSVGNGSEARVVERVFGGQK